MTVAELRKRLEGQPDDALVLVDMNNSDEHGWEGDRCVRELTDTDLVDLNGEDVNGPWPTSGCFFLYGHPYDDKQGIPSIHVDSITFG